MIKSLGWLPILDSISSRILFLPLRRDSTAKRSRERPLLSKKLKNPMLNSSEMRNASA